MRWSRSRSRRSSNRRELGGGGEATHNVRFTRSASGFLFLLRETLDDRRETLVVEGEKPGEFGCVAIIDLDTRFLQCLTVQRIVHAMPQHFAHRVQRRLRHARSREKAFPQV